MVSFFRSLFRSPPKTSPAPTASSAHLYPYAHNLGVGSVAGRVVADGGAVDGAGVFEITVPFDTAHEWVAGKLLRALLQQMPFTGPGFSHLLPVALAEPADSPIVVPDFAIFLEPAGLNEQGNLSRPDWLIEVTDPFTLDEDKRTKYYLYEQVGIREYWLIIPPTKTVYTYTLEAGRYAHSEEYFRPGPIRCQTLPQVAIDWQDLFGV